jgi:two-component system, cell cycle sensor histidine kinase and response regulator CckA
VSAFMSDLLESWGLEVKTSNCAQDALSTCAQDDAFDLVITDYKMPGMNGLQLARELRFKHPRLPVILYTGFNEGLAPADIEDAGVRALVIKPIDPHEVFGLLQTHLAKT